MRKENVWKGGISAFHAFLPYEGIYVVGDGKHLEYPVYLKQGDRVSLYLDQDTAYLGREKMFSGKQDFV